MKVVIRNASEMINVTPINFPNSSMKDSKFNFCKYSEGTKSKIPEVKKKYKN